MKMSDMDNKVFSDILLSYAQGAVRHANCATTDMDYLGFKAEAEAFTEASHRIGLSVSERPIIVVPPSMMRVIEDQLVPYGRGPAMETLPAQKEKNNADRAGLKTAKPRRKVGGVAKDARRVGRRRKSPAKAKRRSPR